MRMHVPLDSLERWKEYLGNSAQWVLQGTAAYGAALVAG